MISYSAIKYTDLHEVKSDFPKSFPKSFPKLYDLLIPTYFNEKEKEALELILNSLTTPKSTRELAFILSCSTRTIKDKYLDKLLQAEVIVMTIPDKPTSSKQQYILHINQG